MKKLNLDGRSYEEKLIEELKQEEEEKQGDQVARTTITGIPLKPGQSEIMLSNNPNGPQVSIVIDKNRQY